MIRNGFMGFQHDTKIGSWGFSIKHNGFKVSRKFAKCFRSKEIISSMNIASTLCITKNNQTKYISTEIMPVEIDKNGHSYHLYPARLYIRPIIYPSLLTQT